jgi:hypothetical protein
VPGQDRVGTDDAGDLFEGFPAELLADHGQGLSLAALQAKPSTDLAPQDPLLGDEVVVANEEFLVEGAGDVGKEAFPGHGRDESLHRPVMEPASCRLGLPHAARLWIRGRGCRIPYGPGASDGTGCRP